MQRKFKQIASFSGGKDSTAMVLEMLERGETIDQIIAFDTGWEFPQMLEHWDKFERYTGLKIDMPITRVYPKQPFDYWIFDRPVCKRGETTPHRFGNGWPSPLRRWCTREKVNAIRRELKKLGDTTSCVGYAADEEARVGGMSGSDVIQRYPLIEWGIDEAEALKICTRHGFDWGGLYKHFHRVSCFCCPLQRLDELRTLRKHFPDLWQTMIDWDARCKGNNPGFKMYDTVMDLERRFAEEGRLGGDFNIRTYNKQRRLTKGDSMYEGL